MMQVRFGSVPLHQVKRGAVLTDEKTGRQEYPVLHDLVMQKPDDWVNAAIERHDHESPGIHRGEYATVGLRPANETGDDPRGLLVYGRQMEDSSFHFWFDTKPLTADQTHLADFNLKSAAPENFEEREAVLESYGLDWAPKEVWTQKFEQFKTEQESGPSSPEPHVNGVMALLKKLLRLDS